MFTRRLEQNGDILIFLNSRLCFNLFILAFKFVKFKKNDKKQRGHPRLKPAIEDSQRFEK